MIAASEIGVFRMRSFPEFLEQSVCHFVGTAVLSDILAHQKDSIIAFHLLH